MGGRSGMTCTVCRSEARNTVDEALVAGTPHRSVAEQHGLSASAVFRHQQSHLPAAIVRAHELSEVAHGEGLLTQIRQLQSDALGILAKAEKAGDLRTALMAVREVRGTLELVGKVTGELVTKVEHTGAVNHRVLAHVSDAALEYLIASAEAAVAKERAVEGRVVDAAPQSMSN